MWLYAITWPPAAAYLLADGIRVHDLAESLPAELVYGAGEPNTFGRLRPARPSPLTRPAAPVTRAGGAP